MYSDPAQTGWPPTLALEVALKTMPVKEICESYGLDRADWDKIRLNPVVAAEVQAARDMLKKDGMAFKARAQLQSLELLKETWALIHADNKDVPPSVKADLIKFTVRVAGYDPKGLADDGAKTPHFSINFQLA